MRFQYTLLTHTEFSNFHMVLIYVVSNCLQVFILFLTLYTLMPKYIYY